MGYALWGSESSVKLVVGGSLKRKSPRNKQSLRPKYQGWIIFSPKKTYEGQGNKVKYPKGHGNM
jgi:hypothetical protein